MNTTNNTDAAVKTATKKPAIKRISRTAAIEMINEAGGRICNVTFTTKKGVRNMTFKKKLGTGGGAGTKVAKAKMGYLTVYDMFAKDWRTIDTRTITELKCRGNVCKVK